MTDRGAQFDGELFSNLSEVVEFNHTRTTSYHSQSNGIIERFLRVLKAFIMARKENWHCALASVLLGIRLTPNESSYTPFTAVTGTFMFCPHLVLDIQ